VIKRWLKMINYPTATVSRIKKS